MYRSKRVTTYRFTDLSSHGGEDVGPLVSHAVKTTKHDEDQSFRIRPEAL